MSARDLVEGEALLDDEEDESYDDETGEVTRERPAANGHFDDSSEEESDDDEEAARAVSYPTCPSSLQRSFQAVGRAKSDCSRFARASLSTKMKRSKNERKGDGRERRGDMRSVNEKMKVWMKRISI